MTLRSTSYYVYLFCDKLESIFSIGHYVAKISECGIIGSGWYMTGFYYTYGIHGSYMCI